MKTVRVRIAPSPTGNLHVGTARTALFNYLFAKRHGGKFILRIEDTDLERSQLAYTQNIFDSLRALGLSWDEGPDVSGPYAPYTQMQRLDTYRDWAEALRTAGKAYDCYCTPEELEAERAQAAEKKENYKYSRRCCDPATAERLKADPNRKPTLRFKIPDDRGDLVINDLIRGPITFDTALLGDFVLVKSNSPQNASSVSDNASESVSGVPTYNFAVVVDDALMEITHIIRGEDHISNTPKQILIYEAAASIGLCPEKLPEFAHVSMILASDKSKLSKRHGATAVSDYIAKGYLPEAFCNFLSLLGWSPPDEQEVGSLEKFASEFSLERISLSPAVFDQDKLNWLNGHYIRSIELSDLLERARPYLSQFDLSQYPQEKLLIMLGAVREPITLLSDLPEAVGYFFGPQVIQDAKLVGEVLMSEDSRQVLARFEAEFLSQVDFNDLESVDKARHAFIEAMKPMKTKTVMWALRVALTGRTHGADLTKTLYILGEETVRTRLKAARDLAAANSV